MSVLLLSEVFPPRVGGSGRWLWELYSRLPSSDVVVMAGEAEAQEAFDRRSHLRIQREPLTLPSWGLLNATSRGHYRRLFDRVRSIVRADQIESIHCAKCLPEGLIGLVTHFVSGIPYLCYVHGEELGIASSSRELRLLTRQVLSRSAKIVANSENTRQLLVKNWNLHESRCVVVHPGVDTTRYRPARIRPELRRAYGWSDGPVLLTVGRLEKRKGHDMMIEALPQVIEKHPNAHYTIIGDGPELSSLKSRVERARLIDHVSFVGSCPDDSLVSMVQQCDLFVLPNRAIDGNIEGFGIVLLEAQACGKPVLAGDSGGTRETMRSPVTGRTVSCEDPSRIASTVLELLENREALEEMGTQARRWAVENFDWSAVFQKWISRIDLSHASIG